MSSMVYFNVSDNRRILFYYSETAQTIPVLIVNYRGNPFVEFVENYRDFAGTRAIASTGFMSTTLNKKDKKLIYEKMLEYGTAKEDVAMLYIWRKKKKLPVFVVYKILNE